MCHTCRIFAPSGNSFFLILYFSFRDVGLYSFPPDGMRVTVHMDEDSSDDTYRGTAVAPHEPRTKMGLYWGYQTRLAKSLKAVFDECPFDGGYDMSIGTSERGEALGHSGQIGHPLLDFSPCFCLVEILGQEMCKSKYCRALYASSIRMDLKSFILTSVQSEVGKCIECI